MKTPYKFDQFVTFLYTDDLAASRHFYADILGLPLTLDQGGCLIFTVCPNSFLGVCTSGAATQKAVERPEGVIVTLVSDDVDGWHARLVAAGVTIEKPPTLYEKFNIYHLFVRDPNGYLVEIQRFLDPSWPKPVEAEAE